MKKLSLGILTLTAFFAVSVTAHAFSISITDPNDDAIGVDFETTGMEISNIYSTPMTITINTVYPKAGITVGDWHTLPADIFVTETYSGSDYLWAIPLIDHGSFNAGGFYAVGSFLTSNDFAPSSGTYVYNEDAPVRIATEGKNYGNVNFFDGNNTYHFSALPTVTWGTGSVVIDLGGVYMDNRTTALSFYWGTATCGNDEIGNNPVPEPGTMLLMGLGLAGLVGYNRKRKK